MAKDKRQKEVGLVALRFSLVLRFYRKCNECIVTLLSRVSVQRSAASFPHHVQGKGGGPLSSYSACQMHPHTTTPLWTVGAEACHTPCVAGFPHACIILGVPGCVQLSLGLMGVQSVPGPVRDLFSRFRADKRGLVDVGMSIGGAGRAGGRNVWCMPDGCGGDND